MHARAFEEAYVAMMCLLGDKPMAFDLPLLLSPTFVCIATTTFFVKGEAITVTLVKEDSGFGHSSDFYTLLNGHRVRPFEKATTPQAGRAWCRELIQLFPH